MLGSVYNMVDGASWEPCWMDGPAWLCEVGAHSGVCRTHAYMCFVLVKMADCKWAAASPPGQAVMSWDMCVTMVSL